MLIKGVACKVTVEKDVELAGEVSDEVNGTGADGTKGVTVKVVVAAANVIESLDADIVCVDEDSAE